MTKINRETVIAEALELLDAVGLDGVSTRQLAKRLGVEQPSLYWHFKNKDELLIAMAEAAMLPHADFPLPEPSDDWSEWFIGNMRSFRRTLLMRRDGARLHAGTQPGAADVGRIAKKMAFLLASGIPEHQAKMAMHAAGRFTVGSVIEEQADAKFAARVDHPVRVLQINHESAFEAGLMLIVDGLAKHKKCVTESGSH